MEGEKAIPRRCQSSDPSSPKGPEVFRCKAKGVGWGHWGNTPEGKVKIGGSFVIGGFDSESPRKCLEQARSVTNSPSLRKEGRFGAKNFKGGLRAAHVTWA